jgi:hypothetical protein
LLSRLVHEGKCLEHELTCSVTDETNERKEEKRFPMGFSSVHRFSEHGNKSLGLVIDLTRAPSDVFHNFLQVFCFIFTFSLIKTSRCFFKLTFYIVSSYFSFPFFLILKHVKKVCILKRQQTWKKHFMAIYSSASFISYFFKWHKGEYHHGCKGGKHDVINCCYKSLEKPELQTQKLNRKFIR